MLCDNGFNFVELVEVERVHQSGETARNTLGVQTRKEVTIERGGLAQIGA